MTAATLGSQRFRVLLAGVFSQILCVGIARFAYTPLLPVMQQQTWMGDADGGWLAALNYVGYMLGAVLAATIRSLYIKDLLFRCGLILAVLTTAGMALTEHFWVWAGLRFLAGLSSSGSMLLASGLILHWLMQHRQRGELGIHFAGLGIGMVVVSVAVEMMLQLSFSWQTQWWGFSLLGAALLVPAWRWLPRPEKPAVLYGGTFLGCVSLVLTMAGRLYPSSPARLMGQMTLAYGVAQICAPALTGMLAEASGNYTLGLWLAGGFVALGAVLLACLRRVDQTAQRLDAAAKAAVYA